MAAPQVTKGAAGNVIAAGTNLAAGVTNAPTTLDYSADFAARLLVQVTAGGAVSTTAGVEFKAYRGAGSTAAYETVPTIDEVIPVATPSTTTSKTFALDNGQWQFTLTNLDATNAVTVEVTSDVVTGIA